MSFWHKKKNPHLEVFWKIVVTHVMLTRGGRTRLPKFSHRFTPDFTTREKKIQKCLISYVKKYFNRKSVEVQRWTPLEVVQNEFCLWITVRCMQRSHKSVLPHWIRLYRPPLMLTVLYLTAPVVYTRKKNRLIQNFVPFDCEILLL